MCYLIVHLSIYNNKRTTVNLYIHFIVVLLCLRKAALLLNCDVLIFNFSNKTYITLYLPVRRHIYSSSGSAGKVMASPGYFGDGPPLRERDPYFTGVISQKMRVPERLRFGPAVHRHESADQTSESVPASYSMHIPDRLALTGEY